MLEKESGDGSMSTIHRNHEWCLPILVLEIKVRASFNHLLRDLRMTKKSQHVERCGPIVLLKITVRFNQQFRDGQLVIDRRTMQRCEGILVLVVDEGLLTLRSKQCFNLRTVTCLETSISSFPTSSPSFC